MVQRTVLKVDMSCQKCKKKLLKAVPTLEGVDQIEADQAKGTLIVKGNADPYEIIIRTRKAVKHVEVVSIGPPPAQKPEEKKPTEKAPIHDPHTCPQCRKIFLVPMSMGPYDQPNPLCSIM